MIAATIVLRSESHTLDDQSMLLERIQERSAALNTVVHDHKVDMAHGESREKQTVDASENDDDDERDPKSAAASTLWDDESADMDDLLGDDSTAPLVAHSLMRHKYATTDLDADDDCDCEDDDDDDDAPECPPGKDPWGDEWV
ncbi:Aste57867_18682 [Aphanomyces stellatus]|uniref:Aste57867_18682 protein n=1 Tax=Aphanomyces stellatus TaxID=120398 RepID=A0A485LCM0_9STRA|nr:hypothetical protein As57867_018620 [Aphanomyces stellatus]VFT95417.1 Aste57867_18682 [Aphanomyces stellatus]